MLLEILLSIDIGHAPAPKQWTTSEAIPVAVSSLVLE